MLFKSPRDKQQISVLARQVNPGHVQEFMKSYEKATKRPHGYLMLDLKPIIDDQHRLKSNVLPEENIAGQQNLDHYIRKRSYQQPPSPMINWNRTYRPKKTPLVNKTRTAIFESDRMNNLPSSTLCTTRINRWSKLCKHRFWHQMKRVPFTLMNYTVSNHSKINVKINLALKSSQNNQLSK